MSTAEKKARLSEILIKYCADNGLSGTGLSKLIKVSQPSAQAYLDGRTYPSEGVRDRIAKALGITPKELKDQIEGVDPEAERPAPDVARDIRLMSRKDFELEIVPVVFDRIMADHRSRIS